MQHLSQCSRSDTNAPIFASLSLVGLMQAKQLFSKRFVEWKRGQSPSYMIRMVCLDHASYHMDTVLMVCLGEPLVASDIHLMPSAEVSSHWWQYRCSPDVSNPLREACMILNTRLHMMEATLSSMIPRVLKQVQMKRWGMLGHLLRRGPLKQSCKSSCMPFGILVLAFLWLTNKALDRYCIPMDSPRPLLDAELQFFNKGTGKGKFWSQLWIRVVPRNHLWYSSFGDCFHQIWWSHSSTIWRTGWHRGLQS